MKAMVDAALASCGPAVMKQVEVLSRLSPNQLFDEHTFINAEWKRAFELRCMRDGFLALIGEHPERGLLFHSLQHPESGRVWKKLVAEYFEEREAKRDERAMQRAFVALLRSRGIDFQEQVHCSVGIADVVDAEWVYELKVDPENVFTAVGQAVLYGAALHRKPCVVFPHAPRAEVERALFDVGVRLVVMPKTELGS